MTSSQPIIDESKRLVEARFPRHPSAPGLYFDRRYDPKSAGLFAGISYGECMGAYLPNGSLTIHDRLVKPEFGDLVCLQYPIENSDPFGKVLAEIGGKLWGLSETAAPMPITRDCNIVGTLVARYVCYDRNPGVLYAADERLRPMLLKHFARTVGRHCPRSVRALFG